MKTFKENKIFAHSFLLCRFDVCYLIDPSHDLESILEALEGRKLEGILLTHAHMDHVDLIHMFDCPIYMHLDDAHLLFEDQYNGYHPNKHPYKRKALNLKYVTDKMKLPLADGYVEVIHTPGHTKGSVCYLYDFKLFSGDTLFRESVGRHDLYSGSLVELRKSIIKLMKLPGQTKVYPGHDENTTIRYEQKHNPYYIKWAKQQKK
jgi:glyoxylase-like metal-dependent hydrolase (beta-lactamase superfamily II)